MNLEPATVFVIDDDESVRRAVDRLLRIEGFRVESFASCAEFLEQVHPTRHGCVVLDVRMPGYSGFDLFELLTGQRRELGVIFVTGHANFDIAIRSVANTITDFQFLVKPFEADELITAVRQALR